MKTSAHHLLVTRLPRFLTALTCVLTSVLGDFGSLAITHAQEKHALLVGVTTYQHSQMNRIQLMYPEKDAEAIKTLLEGAGYKVTICTGQAATRQKTLEALEEIGKQGQEGGVMLLGFFGHGVQYGADGYFCPYDAKVREVRNADGQKLFGADQLPLLEPDPETLVPMREMLSAMAVSGASHKLLIADCCREDPNRARGLTSRAFGSDLKLENLPKNSAALFACSNGEQAFEHAEWGHGAFTKAILEACQKSDRVTANSLSENVYFGVEELVKAKGVRQRVNSLISGGVVDLGIRGAGTLSNQKTISLYPKRQTLSKEEKESRRKKAIAELPKLGSDVETAFIRGCVYGPSTCKFVLGTTKGDLSRYFRELDAVYTAETSILYREKLSALVTFCRDQSLFHENFNEGAIATRMTTPQTRFKVKLIISNTNVCHWANAGMRQYLAVTTPAERVEVLQSIDFTINDNQTDIGIHLALAGKYEEINFSNMNFSHAPFVATIPVLNGDIDRALAMIPLIPIHERATALLLVCDELLDEGESMRAKSLFSEYNQGKVAVATGSLQIARTDFGPGTTSISFELAAYVAGRLHDEAAYQLILNAEKKTGRSTDGLRVAFINGLVRDL